MLIQYIRNKHGEKKGVVVADLINGQVKVGYSLCNSAKDRFNKEFGLKIAEGRLKCNRRMYIPQSAQHVVKHVQQRALRYFKQEVLQ